MGWFGTIFVGAVVGFFGWKLHRARDRFRMWLAVVLGATGATLAKFAGNLSGAFPTLNFLTGLKANTTAFGQPLNINSTNFYRERQIQLGLRMRFRGSSDHSTVSPSSQSSPMPQLGASYRTSVGFIPRCCSFAE